MGKILDSLKGISLPLDVESKIRDLDGQFQQMETTIKALDQGRENLLLKEPSGPRRFNQTDRPKETSQSTPRLTTRPGDPTDDEVAILKVMQPPGRKLDANTIAQLMRQSLRTTQTHLDELHRKDCVLKSAPGVAQGGRPPLSTYALAPKGVRFVIDHLRAE